MRHLIIIGARGFGREAYNLYSECKSTYSDLDCKGFLDDNSHVLDGYDGYPKIISSVESYVPEENDVFVCAMGDPKWKKYYAELILAKRGHFISLIHPSVTKWMNTTIGTGCIINNQTHISCDVTIGNFVTILTGAKLGHDCKVGDWSHLGASAFMGGFSEVKEGVTVHTGAVILPHKCIHNNSIIGAQSVVMKNIPEGITVHGNPAKKIIF